MQQYPLYLQIVNSIRRDIENGVYQSGDALPTLRSFSETWHCTIGTVQRAFQTLVAEGLISSHVGQGTKVLGPLALRPADSLRRANLVNRSESFLLEILSEGYTAEESAESFRIALERWQSVSQAQANPNNHVIRFAGSHDLAFAWLATHFEECCPGVRCHVEFSGSLAGLTSLAAGKADMAGSHLWDEASGTYNSVYLHDLFPGEKLAMITFAHRRMGFYVGQGNPKNFQGVVDLARGDVSFVNRNSGSGTRVFLDGLLAKHNMDAQMIHGYVDQRRTHSEVAAEIAAGKSDVGVGLEAAARAYHLDFIFLTLERYDLVVRREQFDQKPVQTLIEWLKGDDFHRLLDRLGGYEYQDSGCVQWS